MNKLKQYIPTILIILALSLFGYGLYRFYLSQNYLRNSNPVPAEVKQKSDAGKIDKSVYDLDCGEGGKSC